MTYKIDLIRTPGAVAKDDPNSGFVYVIHLSGNFVLEIAQEFNLLLGTLLSGGMRKVALDMAELRYIDSTGIGNIISTVKQIRAKGGDLVFLHVGGKILEIVSLVKLNDFIVSFQDEKQVAGHFFAGV